MIILIGLKKEKNLNYNNNKERNIAGPYSHQDRKTDGPERGRCRGSHDKEEVMCSRWDVYIKTRTATFGA